MKDKFLISTIMRFSYAIDLHSFTIGLFTMHYG